MSDNITDNWVDIKIITTRKSGNTGYGRTEEVFYDAKMTPDEFIAKWETVLLPIMKRLADK